MVTLDDIRAAADGLSGVAHRTPTERSETFTRLCGGEVWLKFENQQRTGSFKIRGAYTKIQSLSPDERAAGVVAPSAGNHAQAVAFAARSAGVDATVYMPEAASLAKVGATEGYGATVRLVGDSVEGSVEAARRAVHDEGRTLVHPFDDEVVIAGQGTVGLEILEDAPDADVVVVPVGGGGLVAGIATAVAPRGVRVVGVEPDRSAALLPALEAGKPVPVTPSTIAGGLDAPYTAPNALAACQAAGVQVVTVPDEAIADAMRRLYAEAKLACEPAGAAGVAAVLSGLVEGASVVAVVSGGNVGPDIASGILIGR